MILVSLGTASFLPTSTDVVFRIAPSNKKGFALALLSQCFAMGYFFGPFISGRILDLFGYASIIWLSISCCCFIAFAFSAPFFLFLREKRIIELEKIN